jgi:hypothetical protein
MSRLPIRHFCKCGEPAERNEFGELVCPICAKTTERAIKKRLGAIRLDFKLHGSTYGQRAMEREYLGF